MAIVVGTMCCSKQNKKDKCVGFVRRDEWGGERVKRERANARLKRPTETGNVECQD